jgi:peptide-methionine (S)-S-oxide reductase
MIFGSRKTTMVDRAHALPGRSQRMPVPDAHYVLGTPLLPPYPGMETAMFAMGCFWGAEKKYWEAKGVHTTAVGYAAGFSPNPTYQEVCTGQTGHAEVVMVAFDPGRTTYEEMLRIFWESHDPTQGMRQGADIGSQYRSGIYCYGAAQKAAADASRATYQELLTSAGHGEITTEIIEAPDLYYAEEYHQQYLAKNPAGYCGIGGTGVSCPVGVARQ